MAINKTSTKSIVCVIGLGYVGLPLAEAFSRSYKVIGFDISEKKIKKLHERGANDKLSFTNDAKDIGKADFIVICVPTPVTRSKEVDLSFVESAAKIAGKNMKKGSTVILESTVYPGVTEEIVKPILEKESGMRCGEDFKIGYSPERINPGDTEHTVEKTIKVVAGMDPEVTDSIAGLYGRIAAEVFKARDIKTAEAAKVIENIQRDLNIALMNELAIIFEKLGLNTRDVLAAASTKWNFHRYLPGLVGGHCIPVDPYYLVHKAEELGYHSQVILAGRVINNSVPARVAGMTIDALNRTGKVIKDSTVLVLGLTYKADVPDIRESATKQLVKELKDRGVQLAAYDPTVDEENYKDHWEKEFDIRMLFGGIKKEKFDAIILTVAHAQFHNLSLNDLKMIQKSSPILIDIPGLYDAGEAKKDGFYYRTL